MTATLLIDKQKVDKAPLELHYLGDKMLRQPAKRIAKVDDATRKLAKEMLQTMYAAQGIGLAAPQVGVNKQLLVVDCELDNPDSPPLIMINPQITRTSEELCIVEEGCLSIPNVFLDVTRPRAIEVTYKDEHGRPHKRLFAEMNARVIQHEMDHLNGVMFVDRVDNPLALAESLKKEGFSMRTVKPIA